MLLDGTTPSERAHHARLLLALEELTRVAWSSLDQYALVRGIRSPVAARRSLFRLKKTFAALGVELEVRQERREISARFGTRAIVDLIEPDLRRARALVARLEGEREGSVELASSSRENELVDAETIAHEYRGRHKSFTWLGRKHGVGKERIRRILASTGPIPAPEVRRCVEERLPRADVDRALEAVERGARVDEIAAILGCVRRTAQRFVKRHGCFLPPGRPRGA